MKLVFNCFAVSLSDIFSVMAVTAIIARYYSVHSYFTVCEC